MNASVFNMPSLESESDAKHHQTQSNSLDSNESAAKVNVDDPDKVNCANDMFADEIEQNDRSETLSTPEHKIADHNIKPIKTLFDIDRTSSDKLVNIKKIIHIFLHTRDDMISVYFFN